MEEFRPYAWNNNIGWMFGAPIFGVLLLLLMFIGFIGIFKLLCGILCLLAVTGVMFKVWEFSLKFFSVKG